MSDNRTWGTVIGAVAGYFTAGVGAGLGAVIGGTVGGLLDPKQKTESGRIDDIKVSVSKYGDGIPVTWGTNIPQATWVWSTYTIQIPSTQSMGKGGGAEHTSYRQFIHGHLCLGKTPPPGTTVAIRKILVDGKLQWDASSGLSVGQALATQENPFASIMLFPGFDDQLPIPIIEAWEGIGNVPAFRGRITAFVFGLECPGGRVPQISVELCINPTLVVERRLMANFGGATAGSPDKEAVWSFPVDLDSYQAMIGRASGGAARLARSAALTGSSFSPYHIFQPPYALVGGDRAKAIYVFAPRESSEYRYAYDIFELDLISGESVSIYTGVVNDYFADSASGTGVRARAAYDSATKAWAIKTDPRVGPTRLDIFKAGRLISSNDASINQGSIIAAYGGFAYVLSNASGSSVVLKKINSETGAEVAQFPGPSMHGVDVLYCSIVAGDYGVAVRLANASDGSIASLHLVNPDSGEWIVKAENAAFVNSETGIAAEGFPTSGMYFCADYALVGPSATGKWTMLRFDVPEPTPAPILEFIASQASQAGLLPGQIDVASIDDTFWGLTLKGPASARANTAPLLTYAGLGVVEEDGLLRYFHRSDKASAATIRYDELGYVESGSESADVFPLVRMNAQELPRSVTVQYNDPNFDYQISTVKAMRFAVAEGADEVTTLDMAMDGSRAASIAHRILYERWLSQMTRSCTLSRAYAWLSAGDVITVEYPRGTLSAWMISKLTDTGAILESECFPMDGDLAIQTVPGNSSYRAQEIAPLAPPTRIVIGDWPILRDADDNAGLYVAMGAFGDGYPGGELFAGESETALLSQGTVQNEALVGIAETALGSWSRGTVDESSLVTINVGHGELESITYEQLLTGSMNVAAVGAPGRWEIIKFQRADDLGNGRFILSGFLRGLRGTEWARGTHQAGDTFVLLSMAGMLRPNLSTGQIGQSLLYRGVTLGRSFDGASSESYANTAEGLRPLAPASLQNVRQGNGDIALSWVRRTRLEENWLVGMVPVGEAVERFDVVLYTSAAFTTVRRTISASTRATNYTAAMQTEDGYTSGPLYVRVFQISDVVGRGHELQATL